MAPAHGPVPHVPHLEAASRASCAPKGEWQGLCPHPGPWLQPGGPRGSLHARPAAGRGPRPHSLLRHVEHPVPDVVRGHLPVPVDQAAAPAVLANCGAQNRAPSVPPDEPWDPPASTAVGTAPRLVPPSDQPPEAQRAGGGAPGPEESLPHTAPRCGLNRQRNESAARPPLRLVFWGGRTREVTASILQCPLSPAQTPPGAQRLRGLGEGGPSCEVGGDLGSHVTRQAISRPGGTSGRLQH